MPGSARSVVSPVHKTLMVVALTMLGAGEARAQSIAVEVSCEARQVTVRNLDGAAPVDAELWVVYAQYEDFDAECDSEPDVTISSTMETGIPAGGSRQRLLGDLNIPVPTGCDTYIVTARAAVPGTAIVSQASCATAAAASTLTLADCTAEPYVSLIQDDLLFSNKIDVDDNGTCASARRQMAVQVTNRPYFCGNGVCDTANGENCLNCAADCLGVQGGQPSSRFCCGDGGGINPVSCADARCADATHQCSSLFREGEGSGTRYEAGVYAKYVCSTSTSTYAPCSGVTSSGAIQRGRNKGSAGSGRNSPTSFQFEQDKVEPGVCLPLGYHGEGETMGRLAGCCTSGGTTKVAVQCAFFAVARVGQTACRPAFLSPETKSVDLLVAGAVSPGFTCRSIQPDHSETVVAGFCEVDDNWDGVIRTCAGSCDNDGVCEADEDCEFCPYDCSFQVGGHSFCCGDQICEAGEECGFCARECGAIACCGNGVCQTGESCDTCAADCPSGPGVHVCGNGVCEPDEDCNFCPQDCRGVFSGPVSQRFCCSGNVGGAGGYNPVDCSDPRCTSDGWACTTTVPTPFCCGNAACEAGENTATCAIDCPSP